MERKWEETFPDREFGLYGRAATVVTQTPKDFKQGSDVIRAALVSLGRRVKRGGQKRRKQYITEGSLGCLD